MREAQENCLGLRVLRLTIIGSTLAIAACVSLPRTEVVLPDAPRSVAALTEWQANGRIAVSGATTGGSGSFTWSQHGDDATVQIRGPVGIGSLRLILSGQSLKVASSNGEELAAGDAEEELARRLGANVPVQDLRYWLVGLAAPGEGDWTNVADQATLTQHDWRIDYQRFALNDGVRLPMKLVATSGPAKVRIVIDRWKVK